MIGKRLLSLLQRTTPSVIVQADSTLSRGDREAIVADLGHADAVEPGLGDALARYVITGEGAAVLLRLEALLQPGGKITALKEALLPGGHAWGDNKAEKERRLVSRVRTLFGMQGFDAAAVQRYGQVFARLQQQRTYFHNVPGSDRSPMWLRELLDLLGAYRRANRANTGSVGVLTVPHLMAVLALDGLSVGTIIDCLFTGRGDLGQHTRLYLETPELAEALAADAASATEAVRALGAVGRATMLGYFQRTGLLGRDQPFIDLAFALAADGAKAVRDAAVAALATAPEGRIGAMADDRLASRDADARLAAVNVLVARSGTGALPRLAEHEAVETSKKVVQAITMAKATLAAVAGVPGPAEDGADSYGAVDGSIVTAPPWVPAPDTVPDDVVAVFHALVAAANEAAKLDFAAVPVEGRDGKRCPKQFAPPLDPEIGRAIAAVMRGTRRPADSAKAKDGVFQAVSPFFPHYATGARRGYVAGLTALLDRPDVSLQSLVRLRLCSADEGDYRSMLWRILSRHRGYTAIDQAMDKRIAAGADLRDIIAVGVAEGRDTAASLMQALSYHGMASAADTPPNPTAWTILAANFAVLDDLITPGATPNRRWSVESMLDLMDLFPRLPRRYFRYLLDRASEGSPRIRNGVRATLAQAGDLTPVILPMLNDGDAKRRVNGARWLGDRRDKAAAPALWAALKTEKLVIARAAIIAALAACGEDISGEFSEAKLLREAEAGLPKTKVDYAALFDADRLPLLQWADGREVPGPVVRWWFAQSHKLRQPGGDPLLHMALGRLRRADTEQLGMAVLSAFIQYDTQRATGDQANEYARANAPARHQAILRWRQDFTEEQAFAELRREHLGTYLNNAQDHRGLLALARYAPPADAVAMVRRFLRDHGKRNNQCRSLLEALAANPVPAVLQLILATSQRHKQPGTRKFAGELAAALAEERGWTPAELADRTVPSAGLDDDGVLDLPIGDRVFRARLVVAKGGLALATENPDGKPVAALPSPTDPSGAEDAKIAKKALTAARKELKQTVELQTVRLYEAMCAARIWPVADFQAYLLHHPIVGPLLCRVVLAGHDAAGAPVGSFRALEDGTFTDAMDGAVTLDRFAGIGIAHRAILGQDAAAAWTTHLADYEVTPLVEQLDRPWLAASEANATAITDRLGHMIDHLALRGAATTLNYNRGAVQDGGCFFTYEKHFAEPGLTVVVNFTGSYVAEAEPRVGALRELCFARSRPGGPVWGSPGIPLGQVPPVLLSEAWNDYHALAARGTGFDPDWEKKAQW